MIDWFDGDGFIPHGFCLAWQPDVLTAVVLSNALIAIAYLAIAIQLGVRAAQPGPIVPRWFYCAFALFIFCCGVSHVLDDVTLWYPVYRLQALVLGVTAMVSLLTATLPVSIWVKQEIARGRWRE